MMHLIMAQTTMVYSATIITAMINSVMVLTVSMLITMSAKFKDNKGLIMNCAQGM